MIIGFDIDDVLFQWVPTVQDVLAEVFGITMSEPTGWSGYDQEIGPEAAAWIWQPDGLEAIHRRYANVHEEAIQAARKLCRAHDVHMVTHRPLALSVHTATFVDIYFGDVPLKGLHILDKATSKAKLLPWDVFVDDKVQTCEEMAAEGVQAFAPIRGWNSEIDTMGNPSIVRYADPWSINRWVANVPPRDMCDGCTCTVDVSEFGVAEPQVLYGPHCLSLSR